MFELIGPMLWQESDFTQITQKDTNDLHGWVLMQVNKKISFDPKEHWHPADSKLELSLLLFIFNISSLSSRVTPTEYDEIFDLTLDYSDINTVII